jgi:hypothetical protein
MRSERRRVVGASGRSAWGLRGLQQGEAVFDPVVGGKRHVDQAGKQQRALVERVENAGFFRHFRRLCQKDEAFFTDSTFPRALIRTDNRINCIYLFLTTTTGA